VDLIAQGDGAKSSREFLACAVILQAVTFHIGSMTLKTNERGLNEPVVRKDEIRRSAASFTRPIFMMQAAEYGSLHNPVSDRQTVSVLVRRDLVRRALRQTGA
jgi:hypothetical protein